MEFHCQECLDQKEPGSLFPTLVTTTTRGVMWFLLCWGCRDALGDRVVLTVDGYLKEEPPEIAIEKMR